MKRNKFGEIENPSSKTNVFILIVAILAVIITGIIYAIKLNEESQSLEAAYKTEIEYYQNQEAYI